MYKMLGVMVNSDLKWDNHDAAITSKAGKRLWFMKQLRKAGVSQDDLCFTTSRLCDLSLNMRARVGT